MQDKTFSEFMSEIYKIVEDAGSGNYDTYVQERKRRKFNLPNPQQSNKERKLAYMLNRDLPPPMYKSMKTFQEFLEVLSEKKKDKKVTRGVVVKPKDVSSYNLSDYPEPKETKPGSPERMEQIKKLLDNGAKRFKS
jgi:hypothetical protein